MLEEIIAATRVGRIVSTTGPQAIVLIDDETVAGSTLQMGSLVKVVLPNSKVFGIVSGLDIPLPSHDRSSKEHKIAEIDFLGELLDSRQGGNNRFNRGVTMLPSLDDIVIIADQADVRAVYALPSQSTAAIGTIYQTPMVSAHVGVDELLGKHFAVLGTTGSGKSCAATLILKRILEQNPNGHVLLLDPHGEYAQAFGDQAEHLNAETLELPYWVLNFEEIVEVVFGREAESSGLEIAHLRELIVAAKLRFGTNAKQASRITADTPVPYSLGDINRLLDEAAGRLDNRAEVGPYLRIKSRLTTLQADRRYSFMFPSGLFVSDNLSRLLGRIFRVPVNGKPIAIFDLAGVPSEVLNVVVSVLCRMAFDFAVWGGQDLPLLLVCEEAHRYAPQDNRLGFEPAKRALARIAKEGRKHGISLCVVSQRPSELEPALLSQCNTVFALRMTNKKDQEIIQATLSEVSSALLSSLPLLGNAEAIVVGEGVPIPMRLRFTSLPPEERPRSSSAPFTKRWQADGGSTVMLDRIVSVWRMQNTSEMVVPLAEVS